MASHSVSPFCYDNATALQA
ncbi:Protein of unknown function [Pyronema omphalodes CBS 100304]|uniref:Uncharacterized protein n=1 Tax=Pyronema omphalodes (strain CBS 100304) TaxID=1076935 RepID=U4LMI3_PYROM|nr:Protein of unknown function [Pyronema omphalodes CBS 100304]